MKINVRVVKHELPIVQSLKPGTKFIHGGREFMKIAPDVAKSYNVIRLWDYHTSYFNSDIRADSIVGEPNLLQTREYTLTLNEAELRMISSAVGQTKYDDLIRCDSLCKDADKTELFTEIGKALNSQ